MRITGTIIITLAVAVTGCGGAGSDTVTTAEQETIEKLVVYTVNYPLAYFAERIGGNLVDVHFPAPADRDPAYWSPDAETIASYQGADLILLNGADYAKWVARATLPTSKLVDTSSGFADRYIQMEGTVTHSHGPEGAHEHTGWASTTWLDPQLAIEQAAAVSRAIIKDRRVYEPIFNERFTALEAELHHLDLRLIAATDTLGDTPLLFSHPVYQYLIRRYGLNAVAVHWEPGEVPDDSAWTELEAILMRHPARWMVWESEPLDDTIAGLTALGVKTVVFDPCGNRPREGDYLAVMATNTVALETMASSIQTKR
jgi:zinc transport system substrate-binding protein